MISQLAELQAFIESTPWQFAKTMPHTPHWYTLRRKTPDPERFEWFVMFIREHGYNRKFRGSTYRCLDVDGWQYWTMGAPLNKTILINRAVADQYHTGLAGGVYVGGAAPPVDRYEIEGSVAFVHDITTGPLPEEYEPCDVLYADPPWESGFAVFNERAGVVGVSYPELIIAVANIILASPVPVVLMWGQKALAKLPEPDQVLPGVLNGGDVSTLVYGASFEGAAGLPELASQFNRVGDFMCGYGRSGRVFREAGKAFTMSDYNAGCIGYIAMNAAGWRP